MAKNSKKTIVKTWVVLILLLCSVAISYSVPRKKYIGSNTLSEMNIPLKVNNWQGKDISDQLNLDIITDTNKFISDTKVIQYVNDKGKILNFIVLDAGNFHHPNACFTAAGYEIRELDDTELTIGGRKIQAHTLYTKKNKEHAISLYWIIIDKKISYTWIEQKIKQLYFSMFNKKRVGLMVRFDVPIEEDNFQSATLLTKQFITDLNRMIPQERTDYIFGEK